MQLVTRKKNFYKHFRVSNSKCDVILRNSDSQIDFVTREFRTSSLATLQESGNFSEVVERLYKSLIGLDKNFAPSFRKRPEKFSRPVAFETLFAFKIVRIELLETDAKLKRSPRIICS